jgi:hypothetical protein
LADTQDLGSCAFGCRGSSPLSGTVVPPRHRLLASSDRFWRIRRSKLANSCGPRWMARYDARALATIGAIARSASPRWLMASLAADDSSPLLTL